MIDISTQAQIAIYSLQPQDQKRVEQRISQLEGFPADEHIRQQVNRLQGFDDLFLVRVTPKLRLIFRHVGDHREVVDIVSHDRLEHMYRYAH